MLYIIQGVGVTLQYTLVSLVLGSLLAILLVGARLSPYRWLKGLAIGYVSVFRGTPLLVQLMVVHYGVPIMLNTQNAHSVFVSGVLTFSLNSAAYLSEIIRAGLDSIPRGQYEACLVLGVGPWDRFFDILFPQAIRNILPSLINEMIDLIKESALISVIGGADIMRRSRDIAAEQATYFGPLLVAAGCYYVLVLLLTALVRFVKRA